MGGVPPLVAHSGDFGPSFKTHMKMWLSALAFYRSLFALLLYRSLFARSSLVVLPLNALDPSPQRHLHIPRRTRVMQPHAEFYEATITWRCRCLVEAPKRSAAAQQCEPSAPRSATTARSASRGRARGRAFSSAHHDAAFTGRLALSRALRAFSSVAFSSVARRRPRLVVGAGDQLEGGRRMFGSWACVDGRAGDDG